MIDLALTALVKVWRQRADGPMPTDKAIGIGQCADELEAALAALAQAQAAPPERDPIVMAAEAGRASCIAALERAIKGTRIMPGTLPLTADECLEILRVIPLRGARLRVSNWMLGLAPLPAAPRPASAAKRSGVITAAPRLTNEEDTKALWLTRRLMSQEPER